MNATKNNPYPPATKFLPRKDAIALVAELMASGVSFDVKYTINGEVAVTASNAHGLAFSLLKLNLISIEQYDRFLQGK